MAITEQGNESVSLAPLFGENSMLTWTQALLEDRFCMNCRNEIDGLAGAMVCRGWISQVDLVGHLCEICRKHPEAVKYYRRSLTIR
jgi:hypothetical protein